MIETAYRRFCRERFASPSETQVASLERRIGVNFPDDYRQFLLDYNGGYFTEPQIVPPSDECPRDRLTFMHGIGASHPTADLAEASALLLFDDNDPPLVVPIGYTLDGGHDPVVHAPGEATGGVIYKQAFGDCFFLAESIGEFFGLLETPSDD